MAHAIRWRLPFASSTRKQRAAHAYACHSGADVGADARATVEVRTSAGLARTLAFVLAALGASHGALAEPARHAAPPFSFAVLSGVMHNSTDEPDAQRLIDAIGLDHSVNFTVYDGNLKGPDEICTDALYRRRGNLLGAARTALVFVPGEDDWSRCETAGAGSFDPVERLDFLRQELLPDSNSLGQNPIALTRESEVPRFRTFRENVRWQAADIVFIGINVPGPNNYYLTAGGRNGEFDDRSLANDFWIEHAVEVAKRRNAHAVVIFMEGDPQFERDVHERFAWLHFGRREHDSFRELRRTLAHAATGFRGPILVVHASQTALPHGFHIDRPLHDENGAQVANVTRIEIAPADRLTQWVRIAIEPNRAQMFRVSVMNVPRHLPKPSTVPSNAVEAPQMPDMPQIETQPTLPDPPASAGYVPHNYTAPPAPSSTDANSGLLEPVAPSHVTDLAPMTSPASSVQNAR